MPENNLRWYIGHSIDLWIYAAGKPLKSRLNMLAFQVAAIRAVLLASKKASALKEVVTLEFVITLLRNNYFPALDTNPYIVDYKANYEMGLDVLERMTMEIINRENMVSTSMMETAMTTLWDRKRLLSAIAGEE